MGEIKPSTPPKHIMDLSDDELIDGVVYFTSHSKKLAPSDSLFAPCIEAAGVYRAELLRRMGR